MYQVVGGIRSRTFRVLWMLEELGLDYEHIPASPRSDEARALNPSGKVPVLVVDGTPVSDSTAILTYLADKHGALTHAPGTLDRARQDSLTQLLLDEFDAILWTASRHSFILPEELRVGEVKTSLKWEFERSQKTLVQRMGSGEFLMGDKMTIADIILTHCGNWAISAKFPVTEPKLEEYFGRMRQRPAYLRTRALDKAA